MFIRLFLIATLLPLQSCSNTKIGEKLENSFDVMENPQISKKPPKIKVKNKLTEIKTSNVCGVYQKRFGKKN